MTSELPAQGLIAGPSVADIRAGADTSTFEGWLTDPAALTLFDYWCRLVHQHGTVIKKIFDPAEISAGSKIFLMTVPC